MFSLTSKWRVGWFFGSLHWYLMYPRGRKTGRSYNREADYSRRLQYLPVAKTKERQDKKAFFLARTRMYQVGTRYLGNCCCVCVYVVESFDVGSNSLYLTLPHRPTRYLYLGGRRGEARQNEKGRFHVMMNGFFFPFRDEMRWNESDKMSLMRWRDGEMK